MSAQAETTPRIEPAAPVDPIEPVDPAGRVPRWWPTFIGNFLVIAMMLSFLFLPVILLLMVVLTAFLIHHIN